MHPSTHDLIKGRLEVVRADLNDALGRLTDADLDWAPTEGMRTVGGQLREIAGTERQLLALLRRGEQLSGEIANDFGEDGTSLEGLKKALAAVRKETLEYLNSLSEEDLAGFVPMPEGWFESLNQPEVRLAENFRSIAQHEWYHVGQLVSYLWSRGDDPYQW